MNELKFSVSKKIISTNKLLCRRCGCRLRSEKDLWQKEFERVLSNKITFKKKVSISIFSYRYALLDKDNAFLSIKAIIDALKEGRIGLIRDDDPSHIEGPYFYQFLVRDKKRERTEITIKEIGA